MPSYQHLSVHRPNPTVVVAELARPARLNAITFEMFDEFATLQSEVDGDPEVRVLVLTGEGRAFCAGLDLDEAALLPGMAPMHMLAEQEKWANSIAGFR